MTHLEGLLAEVMQDDTAVDLREGRVRERWLVELLERIARLVSSPQLRRAANERAAVRGVEAERDVVALLGLLPDRAHRVPAAARPPNAARGCGRSLITTPWAAIG